MYFESIALHVPSVLLPCPDIANQHWPVVACDQFTAQPEYWEKVRQKTQNQPSTLELILPEVYLETNDLALRIHRIRQAMNRYLDDGRLQPQSPGFILVDRQTAHRPSRKGLIAALDLEQYAYEAGSTALIRPTEGTIVSRLPPRVRIRAKAPIELPHIMVLIDDPQASVIEPLFAVGAPQVYDIPLMLGGGRVRGYQISRRDLIERTATALSALATPERCRQRYGSDERLLYAMGDGNHSFAAAKSLWEEIKTQIADPHTRRTHPARYALVELVNIHDAGLEFEPIHRLVLDSNPQHLLVALEHFFAGEGVAITRNANPPDRGKGLHLPFIAAGQRDTIQLSGASDRLEVSALQRFLDHYLEAQPHAKLDYIHGREVVDKLGSRPDATGFYLPALNKNELFGSIATHGPLPRKAFSLGEAEEKRYYLECRRLT